MHYTDIYIYIYIYIYISYHIFVYCLGIVGSKRLDELEDQNQRNGNQHTCMFLYVHMHMYTRAYVFT